MSKRSRQSFRDAYAQQREQGAAGTRAAWARVRYTRERCFWVRLEKLLASACRGVTIKAAKAIAELQGRHFGVVMKSGADISEAAGISESAWWEYARPELEDQGFCITVERGGGLLPQSPRTGRANVYTVPNTGHEPAPPRGGGVRSPAPPTLAQAAQEPTRPVGPGPAAAGPEPRATGPPVRAPLAGRIGPPPPRR